jgi:hypothetical protein
LTQGDPVRARRSAALLWRLNVMAAVARDGRDVLLSERQTALLDELSVSAAKAFAASSETCVDDEPWVEPGSAYEAFHQHWHRTLERHRRLEEKQWRSRWKWIDDVQNLCADTCGELDGLLAHVAQLDAQQREEVEKTTSLHDKCEQMVKETEQLDSVARSLQEPLDLFDRVADVARVLDQGGLASQTDFGDVLEQIDTSIGFLEMHPDFCQAQAYTHQFEHLRNRACIMIRSTLQKSLEHSTQQVEQQLHDSTGSGTVDTQVFYTRFKASALNYRELTALLHKRADLHEMYAVTLEELEVFFVQLRVRLLNGPVTAHLQFVLHKDLEMNKLAPAVRQASTYIFDLSHFERQCFEAYFELRQPQEALRSLLDAVSDIFYRTLRPVVLACNSIDSLREIADCLHMDILEPHQKSVKSDLVPVLSVVFRLHKDVQEKLIFRVQTYIREEIRSYQATDVDLDYPAMLYAVGAASQDTPSVDSAIEPLPAVAHSLSDKFSQGIYPAMKRTLGILVRIYRVLEMSTFQGLAQEAVDICITSLRSASRLLAQRPLTDQQQALGSLVQMLDSQLFLVKHLLLLREHVSVFECDLVCSEKYFDFSNLWEALRLNLPDGLLGILKPKLYSSQVDSKKDIEAELKGACETLITNLAAHITQPLARLNIEMGDFLAGPGGDRMKLKDQPFMQIIKLEEVIAGFLTNLRERVPFVVAHIRVYLANAGGEKDATAAQSTASILFKPVQLRLVDSWGRLEGVLEEAEMDQATFDSLGFIRPKALGELIDSMFNRIMEAPWEELLEIVNKVPRSKVSIRPSPSASPRALSQTPATAAPAATAPPARDAPGTALPAPTAPALAVQEVVATASPPMQASTTEVATPMPPCDSIGVPTPLAVAETVPPLEAPASAPLGTGLLTAASLEV